MTVQLDVKRAVFFCVGHLVRRGQLISGCIGSQTVCKKLLVAGHELAVRNQKIVVRADAVIGLRMRLQSWPLTTTGCSPAALSFW